MAVHMLVRDDEAGIAGWVTMAGVIAYALAAWAFFEKFAWRLGDEIVFGIVLSVGVLAVQGCDALGKHAALWMQGRRRRG